MTCSFLFIHTDRSEGGASIQDGSIEIMVHRRILNDDALGVGEPLNEPAFGTGLVVRGRHLLIAETPAASALLHRVGSQRLFMNPLPTFALVAQTYADYSAAYRQTWSSLTAQLPLNLHLLTLDQLDAKTYLVRVEHYFESNEDANFSLPLTFDLQSIFQSIGTISNAAELTLSANLALTDLKRLEWVTSDQESSHVDVPSKFIRHKQSFLTKYFPLFRRKIITRSKYHVESNANSNIQSDSGINNQPKCQQTSI
jgi:lysosomal alpha-mannosidase